MTLHRLRNETESDAVQLGFTDGEQQALVGQMLYYARRAGYLEGAMGLIAAGTTGVDPQVAAQRALDAVGPDVVADRPPEWTPHAGEPCTLTDAEREAIERLCDATNDMIADDKRAGGCHWRDDAAAVAAVRGLLERTKGGDAC